MKPLLAATVDNIEQLEGRYPLFAAPKLDGIRALVHGGEVVSRNLKPIPNRFVQNNLPIMRMNGWDGELIVGQPWDECCFRTTSSGIMSADGNPKFTFWVFDNSTLDIPFIERWKGLKMNVQDLHEPRVKVVPQIKVNDAFEVYQYEQQMLAKGFEGIMLRTLAGKYKFGRSTLNEGHLMKLKRFADSEAQIYDFEERMHNDNEKTTDELGRAKRSSHRANLHGTGTLGALRVRDIHTGVSFDIGTGFDDKLRAEIWANKDFYRDTKIVKYKYFPSGSKDKPRFPVFLGFRNPNDMS